MVGSAAALPFGPEREGEGGRQKRGARYLRGAVLGIALSLVPFVVVLVVADGMIEGITSRYLETWSYHLQASLPFAAPKGAVLEKAAARLRELPGVKGAWPELRGAAVAFKEGSSAPALLRGVDPGFLAEEGVRRYLSLEAGSLELGERQVLIGKELADTLGVAPGDSLSLLTAERREGELRPRASFFRISGIVSAGYRDLDELWIFMGRSNVERLIAPASRQALVGIKVENPYGELAGLASTIAAELDKTEGGGEMTWTARSWKELERSLFASFTTTRFLLLVIMALSIAVAAVNVSSALIMLVIERSRDIAILKSAGASKGFVALVFIIAGGGTGLAGTLIGLGLGTLLALRVNELIALIEGLASALASTYAFLTGGGSPSPLRLLDPAYYLERIPVRIDTGELALVAGLTLGLCLLSSILPALRAARLPPLEIFRKT